VAALLPGLFNPRRDDNFIRIVAGPSRLRSSFIYLANAVNDLRGNWDVIALALAPLVLVASLCLLPDAINLQYDIVHTFGGSGAQSVALTPAQTPYRPEVGAPARHPFPSWMVRTLHGLLLFITIVVNLVVLCALKRIQVGARLPAAFDEASEVYRSAIPLIPSFFFIVLLQILATIIGALVLMIPAFFLGWLLLPQFLEVAEPFAIAMLIIPGFLVFIWIYFSQYALVFDSQRSWPALLHSRDLMRGRFFKVATRIVVFLAVWSGYNSWTGGAFVVVSLLLRPIAYSVGLLWASIAVIDLLAVGVAYATVAFFFAAGVRLYQDLNALLAERVAPAATGVDIPTAPLPEVTA
jgi:hypothetical protein